MYTSISQYMYIIVLLKLTNEQIAALDLDVEYSGTPENQTVRKTFLIKREVTFLCRRAI